MNVHEKKLKRITEQLKIREGKKPLTLKKRTVSHVVPKPADKKYTDEKLDISDFDEILEIDPEKRICTAEPGVTFEKLVDALMEYNLVPQVVSELKTITIGGAVAGCSIESMSYKYGGFHDSCLEYEVVTAKGDVLVCTPENENNLIFQMMHGTFGTLGIITKLTFSVLPAKKYVKVTYQKYKSLEDYKAAIWEHYEKKDLDFMDGIIHSPVEYVISEGRFVDDAPYTHNYDWTRIYYISTRERTEDYLTTPDYFFRYNNGVTNVYPKSFVFRLFFGRITSSNVTLRAASIFRKILSDKQIPVTVDTFIPFSRMEDFMEWYIKEVNHFPLWCVPYKVVHRYEWIAEDFLKDVQDELFLDIALYGLRRENPEYYYNLIEKELKEIGAIKTLISTNLYTEDEFWQIFNKDHYEAVKKKTDPDNIFRDLYDKTCRAARGLEAT
ncbi:FAD-binding oxidoreductase [Proteiniclasticum sp. C24MP]|uniref:FAD-binding oxidoreductase n=1 Tax=Proteiniclasticum sp. C24MP TaxID=3374101 RepID=UPI003754EBF1